MELIGICVVCFLVCGVVVISKKKGYKECYVGVDGLVFNKYFYFKKCGVVVFCEIFDWFVKVDFNDDDFIEILVVEDGSGVGVVLIVVLILERVKKGNMYGILYLENFY